MPIFNQHSIMFTPEHVDKIRAGNKRQTRRVIQPQPDADGLVFNLERKRWENTAAVQFFCYFGRPGDRVKVRMNYYKPVTPALELIIKNIRVERVQQIGLADIYAEGWDGWSNHPLKLAVDVATEWYRQVWDSINGPRGYEWNSNPWVWVIDFEVVQ